MPSPDASSKSGVKPWRVLHACDHTDTAAALVDAESSVGMYPQILSREFWSADGQNSSLLATWNDVRNWRRALNEAEAASSFHVVHAHSFPSAMAGVRGSLPLVYDFAYTLDEVSPEQSHPGPWLLRSFRVAEQFVLSRASAVVAHSKTMAKIAHDRGAALTNIFRVHPPFESPDVALNPDWTRAHGVDPERHFMIFTQLAPEQHETALKFFGSLTSKLINAILLIECNEADRERLIQLARELRLGETIRCISAGERDAAISCADLVLAFPTGDPGGRSNPTMLSAMSAAKPVIAADVAENRECSEDGAGCLWFCEGDLADLAQRLVFVASNNDFRRELGVAGRQYLVNSRHPETVGRAHDAVYRHAQSRRTETIQLLPAPRIYALGPG